MRTSNTFPITVSYDLSVEEAVGAGKYKWANEHVSTRNFPSKSKGTVGEDIILVKFDQEMGSDAVLGELDKQGLRASELQELLAFGQKYPHVQLDFPVVALGSTWHHLSGISGVPYLDRCSDGRRL